MNVFVCTYVCAHSLLHKHAVYICMISNNKSSIYTQVSVIWLSYKTIVPVCTYVYVYMLGASYRRPKSHRIRVIVGIVSEP